MDKVKPIILTDNETGDKYTLDFSRDTVRFAEARGFDIHKVLDMPQTYVPFLFQLSFRMHHSNIGKNRIDKMWDAMGGISTEALTRLIELYNQVNESLFIEEDDVKENPRMTMEL